MKRALMLFVFCLSIFSQFSDKSYYHFLTSKTVKGKTDFQNFYIEELKNILQLFPKSSYRKESAEALANYYFKKADFHQAFRFYSRMIFLDSLDNRDLIQKKLLDIIKNREQSDFKSIADKTLKIIYEYQPADLLDDLYHYSKFLYELNIDSYHEAALEESKLFLRLFPHSINNDNILIILAKLNEAEGNEEKAAFYYLAMQSIFSESDQIPYVRFQLAQLEEKEFGHYEKAIQLYQALLSDFPNHDLSSLALFRTALIYEKELDLPTQAIQSYEHYLRQYPQAKKAIQSLKQIAGLYDDKKDYENEIKAFKRIINNYSNRNEAIKAQEEVISIVEKELEDTERVIKEKLIFAESFSDHEDAPEYIYDAYQAALDELKNTEQALEIAKDLLVKYPKSKYAKKVKSFIEKHETEEN